MEATVTTTSGRVTGAQEGALDVFRGIPYAAPPTGERRWRPPEPPVPAAVDARRFGPAAPQTTMPPGPLPALDSGPMSEDCLTLNVWTRRGTTGRPVAVWLHGGAFLTGSSAIDSYDGARLAATGTVVVSANYRLGALGFAPIAGTANLGLLDQLLALRWVADNIEAFGGDPSRVMVFGESAGGGSVLHLMCAGTPLFRRAVVQSGATTLTLTADQAGEVADRVRAALAPDDPLTAPVEAVLAAQLHVAADLLASMGTMPFHPAVDGALVRGRPDEVADSNVDLVIGTTAQELNLYLDPKAPTLEPERLAKRAAWYLPTYGVDDPERVLGAYSHLGTPAEVWAQLRTDTEMWVPAVRVASSHAARGGRTFSYRFDWPAAPPNGHLGACHAIDIPFTFGTFDTDGWDRFVGHDDDSARLSTAMQQGLASFAATGDPSSEGLGSWPPYDLGRRATMLLDRRPSVVDDPRAGVRDAWLV